MSNILPISNVVTVSVAQPPAGLRNYHINNLAIFTKETPVNVAVTKAAPGIYLSAAAVASDWGSTSEVYQMVLLIMEQSPNILSGGGAVIIFPMSIGDTLATEAAVLAAIQFFGGFLWAGYAPADQEVKDAATWAQANRVMVKIPSHQSAAIGYGGLFTDISEAAQTQARLFLYMDDDAKAARLAAAAALGRLMSTDFDGSNTCSTMNMKTLIGIAPDRNLTQAILAQCETLGVDCYGNVAGLGKYFSTGGNDFDDNVYNLEWFVYALQVATFNALAQTATKIPQTEPGMAYLRNAAIAICEQAVRNGYVAPGQWNSAELFGNPEDLRANVLAQGWYVWSQPVNQQNQADREARIAPAVRIAIKLAGAIHSVVVEVNINP